MSTRGSAQILLVDDALRCYPHGCFHISTDSTYIKPERRQLPETKSRADVDRGLDIGADMKTEMV